MSAVGVNVQQRSISMSSRLSVKRKEHGKGVHVPPVAHEGSSFKRSVSWGFPDFFSIGSIEAQPGTVQRMGHKVVSATMPKARGARNYTALVVFLSLLAAFDWGFASLQNLDSSIQTVSLGNEQRYYMVSWHNGQA
jgi:hypothetical protein